MAKPQKFQSNFNAGILSPYIEGRPDVAQFYNGMLIGRNIALLPEGGFQKFWGSYYITQVKNNAEAILIAFQPTDEVDFYIEMGAGYCRFYKRGLIVYQIGANLVVNGTFDTDLGTWTDIDQGSGVSSWGNYDGAPCLVLSNMGVGIAARTQQVNLTIGAQYEVTFTVLAGTLQLYLGTTNGGAEYSGETYTPGVYTVRFTSLGTVFITARADSISPDATAAYIDSISMGMLSGAPYEISTPYTLTDINEIKGGQGQRQINDILFICSSRLRPKELVFAGDTNWAIRNSPFDPMPSAEVRTQIHATATLTPAAVTGTGINFHASAAATFLAGDVGRVIVSGAARALITTVTDTDDVVATILADFPSTAAIPAGQWFLEGTPGVALSFSQWGPVGTLMTVTVVGSTATFRAGQDEGKFIRMYGGLVEIVTVVGTAQLTVRILSELTVIKDQVNSGAITPPHTAPIGSWTLETEAWSDILGWPIINEFFQGRYVLDSNNNQRTTKWFSQTNDFYNFALGALATDAIQYTHRSGKFGTTKWLMENGDGLFYGDAWAENSLKGRGVGEPIGGDEIPVAKSEARIGSALMRPLHIGSSLLYLDWTQRRVMAMGYNFDRDAFLPKNTMFASRELPVDTARGFTRGIDRHAPAYMADPIPLDFWRRNDGVLLVHSFNDDPEGGNNGWTTLELDGEIESYCVVRRDRTNILVLLVKRTIAGATRRYIEEVRPEQLSLLEVPWTELQTQCATILTKTDTTAQTIFTGLSHLELKQVDVLLWKIPPTGDGIVGIESIGDWQVQVPRYMGAFQVVSGQITLTEEIDYPCRLEIGIPFRPFVKTMRASIPEAGADGHLRRWSKFFLRMQKSSLPVVNGTDMQALRSVDTIGQGPYLRSGDYFVDTSDEPGNSAWDTSLEAYVEITQTKPYPLRVLMAGGELEVSESMGEAPNNEGTIHTP